MDARSDPFSDRGCVSIPAMPDDIVVTHFIYTIKIMVHM